MTSEADRNLLLGIHALRRNWISRDDLIAALDVWEAERLRPLGQILLEWGFLSEPQLVELQNQLTESDLSPGSLTRTFPISPVGNSDITRTATFGPSPTDRADPFDRTRTMLERPPTRPTGHRVSSGCGPVPSCDFGRSVPTPKEGSASSASPTTTS